MFPFLDGLDANVATNIMDKQLFYLDNVFLIEKLFLYNDYIYGG